VTEVEVPVEFASTLRTGRRRVVVLAARLDEPGPDADAE
jgi:hypothetical protein